MGEDAQAEPAREQPLLLVDRGAERQRHQLVGRGEMLLLQALDIARPFGAGARSARIGVDRPDAGIRETLDQGVAVLGRIGDLRQVGDGGDAGIERAQRTDQIADIGVFGTIVIGGGAGNVAEIVREHAVRQHVAQRALIEMMVRVDEARQHDHARRVDHGRVGADIRAHGDDLLVLDQDVGLLEISDGGIVAEHHAALEQGTDRAALGDRGPRDAGDGGRREQRGSGFHQSAPVDSRCCRSRQSGAVARVTHGAFLRSGF